MNTRRLAFFHILQVISLVAAFGLAGYMSLYKGWGVFLVWPLLLVTVPLVIYQNVQLYTQLSKAIAHRREVALAIVQILGFLAFYVCLTGVGDVDMAYVLAGVEMPIDSPFVNVLNIITVVGGLLFCAATIALGLTLRSNKKLYNL
jgi:hypothetical protein